MADGDMAPPMTFDPDTFPLEADLSRADVRVLHRLCAGRRVVEFGCGGSTVLLAHFVPLLLSYDTDPSWVERTKQRIAREPLPVRPGPECGVCPGACIHRCILVEHFDETDRVPADLPAADVYFIDGYVPLRAAWLEAVITRRLAETIIIHDSRSSAMTDIGRVLAYPLTLSLRSLEYHADGSNLLIVRAGAPCEWVNWNEAEPDNRLPFLEG